MPLLDFFTCLPQHSYNMENTCRVSELKSIYKL